MKQHRGPTNKGELRRVARRVGALDELYRRADERGQDERANALFIMAEIESGRLVGRRIG